MSLCPSLLWQIVFVDPYSGRPAIHLARGRPCRRCTRINRASTDVTEEKPVLQMAATLSHARGNQGIVEFGVYASVVPGASEALLIAGSPVHYVA